MTLSQVNYINHKKPFAFLQISVIILKGNNEEGLE